MRKTIPRELAEYQEILKSTTLGNIQKVIDDLKAEGFIVSKKLLIERTGFSASLFSKSHVKELLKSNSVCQYKNRRVIPRPTNAEETIAQLQAELSVAHKKIANMEKQANERKQYTGDIETSLEEAKNEIELLRGQLFIFVEKAKIYGLNLE